MNGFTPALQKLVEHFRLLPGVGYKSALRMAFHILEMPDDKAKGFAEAILEAKEKIGKCKVCMDISEERYLLCKCIPNCRQGLCDHNSINPDNLLHIY